MLYTLAFVAGAAAPGPTRILFVGNSLTYAGNLPAVFAALAAENGKAVQTGLLVEGGATLTQWLDSGAVQRALAGRHYDYMVLQERGDDFACGFGPKACSDSRRALHELARVVRAHGARPILMGTYQTAPAASRNIVAAESKASRANDVPYVAISGRFNEGHERFAHADGFAKAGHPGHDPVLLEAVLLYRHLYGALPQAQGLEVRAPMFGPGGRFAPPAPPSEPLLPAVALAGGYDYSRNELAHAIELANGR